MKIGKGCYELACWPALTTGEVIVQVADPERQIAIQVGGEDLVELIAYLKEELSKGAGD
jgi:hypothetical protein